MEYPGYGHPGMQQGMYAPPPAPGLFSTTMAGFSDPNMQATGGHLAGSYAASSLGGVPTGFGSAVIGGSMLAGMGGLAAMQSTGLVNAGFSGFQAVPTFAQGARAAAWEGGAWAGMKGGVGAWGRQAGYGVLKTAEMLDPTTYIFRAAGVGGRAGTTFGANMLGVSGQLGRGLGFFGRMGAIGQGMQTGWAAGMAEGGMGTALRGAVGFGARAGGAYGMGLAGGIAGAAVPIAAAYGAYKGLEYTGKQLYRGSEDVMQGQALMNDLGPQIAPGQNMRGQGAETGRMMRDMAQGMGTEMEDIGRFAKQLSSQRVFQTTRSAKEFRDKFKEVMGAVKEIAQITQSSVDDAMQMFTDLRQQGFYTTADIKSQAASRQAREMTTGISAGVYSAIGGVGAQQARAFGMRGRFGAQLAEREVAGVSMGMRSGRMSEEEIMEMGGPEAVGMRMAQQQMGFLGTARGRAMIAYSMGEGGAPDPERLQRLLSGTTIEDVVTGAAGRGLGVLRAAGGREAKEEFQQYAGMAMVSMAAAQQRQLYGGATEKGIKGMLGTMGLGVQEAELLYQQTMQMPEQLRQEQRAAEAEQERVMYEGLKYTQEMNSGWRIAGGPFTRAGRAAMDRNFGRPLRAAGADIHQTVAGAYGRQMTAWTGGEVYREGGDIEMARQARGALRRGELGRALQGGSEASTPFGLASSGARFQSQYAGSLRAAMGEGQAGFNYEELGYGSEEAFQAAIAEGEVISLGAAQGGLRTRGIGARAAVGGVSGAALGAGVGAVGLAPGVGIGAGVGAAVGAGYGAAFGEGSEVFIKRSAAQSAESAFASGRGQELTEEQVRAGSLSLYEQRDKGRWKRIVGGAVGGAAAGAGIGAGVGFFAAGAGAAPGAGIGALMGGVMGGVGAGMFGTGVEDAARMEDLGAAGWASNFGVGGLTLASLDPTGGTQQRVAEHGVYSKARMTGVFSGTWEEYQNLSTREKEAMRGRTYTALEQIRAAGGTGADTAGEYLEEMGPAPERGLLHTRDIQAARDRHKELLGGFILGKFGGYGVQQGKQRALVESLATNSTGRQAYHDFMTAMVGGEGRAVLEDKLEAVRGAFGKDSAEYKAILAQRDQYLAMDDDERGKIKKVWEETGGAGMRERALVEQTFRQGKGLRTRLTGMSEEMRRDPRWEKALTQLGTQSASINPLVRQRGMDMLFGEVLSDAGIDDQEFEMLNKLSPGAGTRLKGLTEELTSGKVSGETVTNFADLLGAEGDEGEADVRKRLEQIQSMKPQEQGRALQALLREANIQDVDTFGVGDAGGTSIRGTPEAYVAANEDFVQAVHAFVSAIGKSWIGKAAGLTVEGGEVIEAGNNVMGQSGGVDTGTS